MKTLMGEREMRMKEWMDEEDGMGDG